MAVEEKTANMNKADAVVFASIFLVLAIMLSACTGSLGSNNQITKPHFEFSNKMNVTVTKVNENFTGWWKLYMPNKHPQTAVIETLSRNNSEKVAINYVVIPADYSPKNTNYTYASKISAFYASNKSFDCCKLAFNESGTYYVDEYLYNCSTLNDYFINACDSLKQYAKNIIAANPKGIHARMIVVVTS